MRALSFATVFVALAGYLVVWIASKALTPEDYVDFMVFWGLFFALTGLIDGLMQETARGATAARHSGEGPAAASSTAQPFTTAQPFNAAQPFRLAGGFAACFGGLSLLSAYFWAERVSPDHPVWTAVLISAGLASFSFQAILSGLLSAASGWRRFAWLIAIDSGIRLLLAALAWFLGWGVISFFIITVIGAATWTLFAVLPGTRELLEWRTDTSAASFIRRGGKAMLASGANSVLITGFPVLLRATTELGAVGHEAAEHAGTATVASGAALAGTITAVTVTRAPLLVPLQRFQPALIVHFTRHRGQLLRATRLPLLAILGLGAAGGVAAWLIGRPLMALLFDEDYLVSPLALGLLTFASAGVAALMVTGSAALAAGRHDLYWVGWVLATVTAAALMCVDAPAEARAILALGLGPVAGILLQLFQLRQKTTQETARKTIHSPG